MQAFIFSFPRQLELLLFLFIMVVDVQHTDIIFPLSHQDIMAHSHRQALIDIAFWCRHGVEVYCFDPSAVITFDWHCFMHCVFRWATAFGIRPISMIGCNLPRRGYDLKQDFEAWLLHSHDDEKVTALV